MTPIDLGSYKSIYLKTAKDYVRNMFESRKTLENNPKDRDAVNNLHIASHSLKSQSQVMGFTDIANTSFSLEKTSNDVLNGLGIVDEKFLAFLKQAISEISSRLVQIEKGDGQ
jgi:chemotaxis protein histidine kinase CheA